jgi:hypothetical protein
MSVSKRGDVIILPCGHHGQIVVTSPSELLVKGPAKQPYCKKCHPSELENVITFIIIPCDENNK